MVNYQKANKSAFNVSPPQVVQIQAKGMNVPDINIMNVDQDNHGTGDLSPLDNSRNLPSFHEGHTIPVETHHSGHSTHHNEDHFYTGNENHGGYEM